MQYCEAEYQLNELPWYASAKTMNFEWKIADMKNLWKTEHIKYKTIEKLFKIKWKNGALSDNSTRYQKRETI